MDAQEKAKLEVKPEKKQNRNIKIIMIISAIAVGGFLIILTSFACGVVVGKESKFSITLAKIMKEILSVQIRASAGYERIYERH
jgi:hypothetical protein